jgi:hypothetical protein
LINFSRLTGLFRLTAKLLLALTNKMILVSEFHRTHDDILLFDGTKSLQPSNEVCDDRIQEVLNNYKRGLMGCERLGLFVNSYIQRDNLVPELRLKNNTKKIKKYLLVPARFRTTRSYNVSNARENASSRIAHTSLLTVCWIDETASTLVPFIAIFNLENKKSQPVLNKGSSVLNYLFMKFTVYSVFPA